MEVYNEETLEGPWNIASQDSKTWSYHWNIWYDVDADGLKDVMAARLVYNFFFFDKKKIFFWTRLALIYFNYRMIFVVEYIDI